MNAGDNYNRPKVFQITNVVWKRTGTMIAYKVNNVLLPTYSVMNSVSTNEYSAICKKTFKHCFLLVSFDAVKKEADKEKTCRKPSNIGPQRP